MASRSPSLSPPPLKRRRTTAPIPPSTSTTTPAKILPSKGKYPLRQDSLRIHAWNINGIAPYLDRQPLIKTFFPTKSSTRASTPSPSQPSLRACLHRWAFPHIVCLQEVKIAPSDISSQASVRRVINSTLPNEAHPTEPSCQYDAHFSLPRDKYNATGFGGKVYGVCTLVRRDVATSSVTKTVEWDVEGRVLITELPDHGVVVFNIYAVNGTTNPYRDPHSGKTIGDRHMRKRAFHLELRDECSRYESQGWDIVIAGDLNISQTPLDSYPQLRLGKEHVLNRQHFKDAFMIGKEEGGLGMRDSFRQIHGEEKKYSYRPPGRVWGEGMDRVDLILVSERARINGADILDSELERGRSDHVPLWVEVSVRSIEGEMEAKEEEGMVSETT
ncbi:MAG: hypothetical protein LQ337_006067 [Flavoplaca oasis]|nr:MAG: hypothetical protein LQ337_006067 [Flavoplaca oasis]